MNWFILWPSSIKGLFTNFFVRDRTLVSSKLLLTNRVIFLCLLELVPVLSGDYLNSECR
jgi:hypothetical protein